MPLSLRSSPNRIRACPSFPQRVVICSIVRTTNDGIIEVPGAYNNHNTTTLSQNSCRTGFPMRWSPYVVMSAFLTTMKRSVKSDGSNEQLARSYPSYSTDSRYVTSTDSVLEDTAISASTLTIQYGRVDDVRVYYFELTMVFGMVWHGCRDSLPESGLHLPIVKNVNSAIAFSFFGCTSLVQ